MDLRNYSETHGGIHPLELQEYGFKPEEILDFSVNSNPFGPNPKVLRALAEVDISAYPERDSHTLRVKLADLNGVQESQMLIGNGSCELIWLVCQAKLRPGDEVLIIGPTFGEYARASSAFGAQVFEISAEAPHFEPPLQKAVDYIRQRSPKLVFLCNPNNPTGKFLSAHQLIPLIEVCGERTLLVIDEAYLSFVTGKFFSRPHKGNTLCLRSMTKDFAVAGLRLGYAIGDPDLLNSMRFFQPTWSVNRFAQVAGLKILDSLTDYTQTLIKLKALSAAFFNDLCNLGYQVCPGATHYCIFPTRISARSFRQELLKSAIQVRDCTSFDLPHHIRVSTKLSEQNETLISCLKNLHLC